MKNNSYALVTGSSSGIGKAMAHEFAKRKFNVLLVALPGPEIHGIADDIRQKFSIKVDVLEIDLTHPSSARKIFNWCTDHQYRVQVLVNNAGFGNLCALADTEEVLITRMLALNNHAMVTLTQLFISHLKTYQQSYILNVGSLASFIPIPNKAVYAASKSFVYTFSAALRIELRHLHIHVSCLCPGGTITSIDTNARAKEIHNPLRNLTQTSEQVASHAVIKLFEKKEKIIPGWHNKGLYCLSRVVPLHLKTWILLRIFAIKKHNQLVTSARPAQSTAFALIFR
ncbi:MAG TPA: SDR family NAD(P)-dependent oxidoreductase [Chryseolinea sp.]